MQHPTVRLSDGSDGTSPELRDDVKQLQGLLSQDGFDVKPDGIFGRETECAVRLFQNEHGLADDGIAGPLIWAALEGTNKILNSYPALQLKISHSLGTVIASNFFYDLQWRSGTRSRTSSILEIRTF